MVSLGVNIDHVATLRNARGTDYPDPVQAALIAEKCGADGITAHLREDRRHIRDEDILRLKEHIQTRLNLEMANTAEMLEFALKVQPYMVTLVPERREEITTEGGLDVLRFENELKQCTHILHDANIMVSLFIEPNLIHLEASQRIGAKIVEFHTGRYCHQFDAEGHAHQELSALMQAASDAVSAGIEVNAGHGLNYHNVGPVLALPGLVELNIGHSLIADAVFAGLGPAVQRMKERLISRAF